MAFKPLMGKRQEDLILDHLYDKGSITGMEADHLYKVKDLPRRILNLRNDGYKITSVPCTDSCGQRYVRYKLGKIAGKAGDRLYQPRSLRESLFQ